MNTLGGKNLDPTIRRKSIQQRDKDLKQFLNGFMITKLFKKETHKFILSEEIKKLLSTKDIFILEQIGIPKKIPYTEINFIRPRIIDGYFEFGYSDNLSEIRYGIKLNTGEVVSFGYYYSIKNSSLEQFILCVLSFDLFVNKLILSESLGAYYDNSPEGGNFEKYANVLEMLIKDIDERATKEGVWHSLIEEMRLGVI